MGKKERKKKGQSEHTKKPVQSIPLTPDMDEGLKEQFRRFKEKFGRPPGPDDPTRSSSIPPPSSPVR
jgi:hypothetical protein